MNYIRYIQVTDKLVLELWPSKVCDPPVVWIRTSRGQVYVKLADIHLLVEGLLNAALELVELEFADDGEGVKNVRI